MKIFLLTAILCAALISSAQEKPSIDNLLYDSWKSLSDIEQSPSGRLITYTINPSQGDGYLFLEDADGNFKKSFPRGKSGNIHFDEQFFVFQIAPYFDTIRQLKLDKVKEEKLPKDSLAIYWPKGDSTHYFSNIASYQLAEKGDWLVFLSTEDEQADCPESKSKKKKKKKTSPCDKIDTKGKTLTVYNPLTGSEKTIHCVSAYEISKDGKQLLYVSSLKGDKDTLTVHLLSLPEFRDISLASQQLAVNNLQFDERGKQAGFLATPDTNEKKNFDLWYWASGDSTGRIIVDSSTVGMPEGWTVSEFCHVKFSEDGSKLYLGTNKIVRQDPKDTLLDSEKAKVDVWSGFDPLIQPNQLNDLKQDLKKNYTAVYFTGSAKFVQLADEKVEDITFVRHANINGALGFDAKPYYKERTWLYPWRTDVYYVDLESGSKQALLKGAWHNGSLSPSGNYYVWFNPEDSCWYGKHINDRENINLTPHLKGQFAADNNGQPSLTWSEGTGGWTLLNGDEYYLVYTEWDIFAVSPKNPKNPVQITKEGETGKTQFRLWNINHPDSVYVDLKQMLIHGTDDKTKRESIYSVTTANGSYTLNEKLATDHRIIDITKAKNSDRLLFRRMSFTHYPELEATNLDFKTTKTLSKTNPEQNDYNWGTVELISWKSFEGRDLRGLLYKPENFDSTKSYPLMVYYYEKYQNSLHNYYSPKATASIVYPTEYVSNGYIVFIPDILYTPGHPAKSAYDCIISGTDFLTNKYAWIDTNRMALQGQSWGGYQTAMLVTMTDKFAAAMAGAPVSNMFSAYGGIRWGSGLSRMFQYECTQSRIGHTIWERPDLYLENSPVFHLPNVETPLLIMHNDNDGAVPWYQGIEMYMGMRRLNKDVWLLNYNGDNHNLTQLANKKDLSIRMRQFFDHYLLGAPKPQWMENGVPAVDKGKNYGCCC